MRTILIGLVLSFLLNGCSIKSRKVIKLEKLALISKENIEKKYLTLKYIKNMGGAEGVTDVIDQCVTTVSLKNKYFELASNTFLEIVFSSKDKVLIDYRNNKGLGQGILIDGGIFSPYQVNFCPLVEKSAHHFIYTYFYPTKTKTVGRIGDIKKIKELQVSVSRTGSLSKGVTPAMNTNKIIISKKEIDKLF